MSRPRADIRNAMADVLHVLVNPSTLRVQAALAECRQVPSRLRGLAAKSHEYDPVFFLSIMPRPLFKVLNGLAGLSTYWIND